MNVSPKYGAAVVPAFFVVAAIAVRAEWTVRSGREVRLEVGAYDPMDALSGRYSAVPLVISRNRPAPERPEDAHCEEGDTVWAVLEPGEPFWRAARVLRKPPSDSGTVALRGTVGYSWGARRNVDFGPDRFFIPADGADPSTPRGAHRLIAVVMVGVDGTGVLTDLLVDGVSYARWNATQPRERRYFEEGTLVVATRVLGQCTPRA